VLDHWVRQYIRWADNWEQDLALAALVKILQLGAKMLEKNPSLGPRLQPTLLEAAAHKRRWGSTALQPKRIDGLMREISPVGKEEWSGKHPVAEGLTGEGYDSIVEIVTKAYDPETEQGRAALVEDMTRAAELAGKIEARTGTFSRRVPLESVSGVTAKARQAFIGSENVQTGAQRTDASVQSTMAVDLKELYGFFLVGMGNFTGGGFAARGPSTSSTSRSRTSPRTWAGGLPRSRPASSSICSRVRRCRTTCWGC
jgi:hypothetical protein